MLIKRTERQARRGALAAALASHAQGALDRRSFLRRSGLAAGGLAALGTRGDVQRQILANDPRGLLGGDAKGVDGTADFATGVADRLADFDGEDFGELFGSLAEPPHDMMQNAPPGVAGHLAAGFDRAARNCDRFFNGSGVGQGHPGTSFSGDLVGNHEVCVGGNGLAGEVIGKARRQRNSDGHRRYASRTRGRAGVDLGVPY